MPFEPYLLAWVGAGLMIGIILTSVGMRLWGGSLLSKARRQAAQTLSDAEREAAATLKEAEITIKAEGVELHAQIEKEAREQRKELVALEKRILAKEEALEKRADTLDRRGSDLNGKERDLVDREKTLNKEADRVQAVIKAQTEKLETVSGMTADQARKALFEQLETEVRRDSARRLKRIEEELVETAEKKARWILGEAVQRCASDHVANTTVSVVDLPNDEMKGRIIGREGRNIRALEAATGINVIIDDTPEAVILSGFDPIRRETARLALERLITDGRIHPGRIEEVVDRVQHEMAKTIKERGEETCLEVDVHGLHPEIVKLLGRLSYRTSYGQNVLRHSKEVAHLAGIMAAELGVNIHEAKRAGLIHDIGKAVNHEVEGSHALIGRDLARRHGEDKVISNATAAHHGEVEPESVIAVLIQAADALSAARPGARSETVQSYIKRLEQLESIADGFEGVEKSYAIQAGREVRVVVQPEKLDDARAMQLARDVARKVEAELTYPGQIKVTVVRETRAVEVAK